MTLPDLPQQIAEYVPRTADQRYLLGIYAALTAQNELLGEIRDHLKPASARAEPSPGPARVELREPATPPAPQSPTAADQEPEPAPENPAPEVKVAALAEPATPRRHPRKNTGRRAAGKA